MTTLVARTTGSRKARGAPRRGIDASDVLASAIEKGEASDGPVVLEARLPETKSVHLVVIWNGWGDLDFRERARGIMEAAERSRRLAGNRVTVAMGLDPNEALRMGYLPYAIRPLHRPGDKVSPARLASAMKGAGGIRSGDGDSGELRFATRERAEEAYRALSEKVPGPCWLLVHELERTSDRD